MNLTELALQFKTDKFQHGYCPAYEFLLTPLRNEPITLVEIGVLRGNSLRMWEAWMPRATIIGIEKHEGFADVEHGGRASVVIADVLEWEPSERVDVIVDDGSHASSEIMEAFIRLWPWLKPGGWYVIEDCATQWLAEFQGSPEGSPVTQFAETLMSGLLREAIEVRDQGAVSELHVWPQLLAMRCRPLKEGEVAPALPAPAVAKDKSKLWNGVPRQTVGNI